MGVLINLSIISSIAALLTLGIRRIFFGKVSTRAIYILWAVLLIRLSIPIFPTSPISIFNKIPLITSQAEKVYSLEVLDSDNRKGADQRFIKQEYSMTYENGEILSFYEFKDTERWYKVIWLIGALLVFFYFNTVYLAFTYKMRQYPVCKEEKILALLESCKEKINLSRKIEIKFYPYCPMTKGILRPQILMPQGYSEEEMEYVLLHELNHIKGYDVLMHYAALLFLCINWFNPIMWYTFFRLKKDSEYRCDEKTIQEISSKKAYANIILKTALLDSGQSPILSYTAQKGSDIKNRITQIASVRQRKKRDYICYMIVMLLFVGTILTQQVPVQAEAANNNLEIPKSLMGAFETTIKEQASECIGYEICYICEEEDFIYLLLTYKKNEQLYERFMILSSTFKEDEEAFELMAQEERLSNEQPACYKWQRKYLVYGVSDAEKVHTIQVMAPSKKWYNHSVKQNERGYILAVKEMPACMQII